MTSPNCCIEGCDCRRQPTPVVFKAQMSAYLHKGPKCQPLQYCCLQKLQTEVLQSLLLPALHKLSREAAIVCAFVHPHHIASWGPHNGGRAQMSFASLTCYRKLSCQAVTHPSCACGCLGPCSAQHPRRPPRPSHSPGGGSSCGQTQPGPPTPSRDA